MCGSDINFPSPDEIGQSQADYNRLNQYTPYGSVEYFGDRRNTVVQSLSPEMLELQNALMGTRSAAMNQLMERFGGTPYNIQNPDAPTFDENGDPVSGGPPGGNPPGGPHVGSGQRRRLPGSGNPGTGAGWGYGDPNYGDPPTEPHVPQPGDWDYDPWQDNPNNPDYTGGGKGLREGQAGYPSGGIRRGASPDARRSPYGSPGVPGARPYSQEYGDIGLDYDLGMDDVSFGEDRDRMEKAFMDRARGLLDPMFAEQQTTLDERMANRGMPTGGEEGEILQGRLGRERGGAYEKAALDAILYGSGEVRANRGMTLNERMSQFGAQSQARNQLFGEDTMQFNQLASILGLSQTQGAGGDLGSFYGPGNVDMMSAYNMGNQGMMYNNDQKIGATDIFSGLMGLGGAAMMCDVNLKKDFTPIDEGEILELLDGVNISSWKYKLGNEDNHIGPMAQDFNEKFGTNVTGLGFEAIDTVSAIGVLMASVKELKRDASS